MAGAPALKRDIHVSRQHVYRLVTKAPKRVNIDLLAARCDILGGRPDDLREALTRTPSGIAVQGHAPYPWRRSQPASCQPGLVSASRLAGQENEVDPLASPRVPKRPDEAQRSFAPHSPMS